MPGVLWHFLNINKNLVKASWDSISLLKLAPDIIAFSNEIQPPNLLVQAHVLTKVSFSSWIFLTLVLNSTLRDSGRVSSAFLTARCFINSPRGSHLCSVFAGGKNKKGLWNGCRYILQLPGRPHCPRSLIQKSPGRRHRSPGRPPSSSKCAHCAGEGSPDLPQSPGTSVLLTFVSRLIPWKPS